MENFLRILGGALVGLFLWALSGLAALSGYVLTFDPANLLNPGDERALLLNIVGGVFLLLAIWGLVIGFRLIFNCKRADGGLVSPTFLKVAGVILILSPVVVLITGLYQSMPGGLLGALGQGFMYIGAGMGAIALAKKRRSVSSVERSRVDAIGIGGEGTDAEQTAEPPPLRGEG